MSGISGPTVRLHTPSPAFSNDAGLLFCRPRASKSAAALSNGAERNQVPGVLFRIVVKVDVGLLRLKKGMARQQEQREDRYFARLAVISI